MLLRAADDKARDADAAGFMMWDESENKIEVNSSRAYPKEIEAARDAHHAVYNACDTFYNKYNTGYVQNISLPGKTYDDVAESFYNKLQSIYFERLVGRVIILNSNKSIVSLINKYVLGVNGGSIFTAELFKWVADFLSAFGISCNRSHDVIHMYNDHANIIDYFPIDQRVKNQRGVLMFCKNIRDEVYLASYFNDDNTVSAIDEEHLSQIRRGAGVIKIIIPMKS